MDIDRIFTDIDTISDIERMSSRYDMVTKDINSDIDTFSTDFDAIATVHRDRYDRCLRLISIRFLWTSKGYLYGCQQDLRWRRCDLNFYQHNSTTSMSEIESNDEADSKLSSVSNAIAETPCMTFCPSLGRPKLENLEPPRRRLQNR